MKKGDDILLDNAKSELPTQDQWVFNGLALWHTTLYIYTMTNYDFVLYKYYNSSSTATILHAQAEALAIAYVLGAHSTSALLYSKKSCNRVIKEFLSTQNDQLSDRVLE